MSSTDVKINNKLIVNNNTDDSLTANGRILAQNGMWSNGDIKFNDSSNLIFGSRSSSEEQSWTNRIMFKKYNDTLSMGIAYKFNNNNGYLGICLADKTECLSVNQHGDTHIVGNLTIDGDINKAVISGAGWGNDYYVGISHVDVEGDGRGLKYNYGFLHAQTGNVLLNIPNIDDSKLYFKVADVNKISMNKDGYFGIGLDDPEYPLHVDVIKSQSTTYLRLYRNGSSLGTESRLTATSRDISGYFINNIYVTDSVLIFSDRRIKSNIIDIPDNLALEQLRNIPCRYYEYIDKHKGFDKTMGFIAQEVKSVLPMAVSEKREIIPDIFKEIICNWTSYNNKFLMSSPDLENVNDIKYRFFVSNNSNGSDEKMIEIKGNSDNTFTFDSEYNNVFCYGREVDDFNTLDKNKLFTLNFSATQEIDKIQQKHINEISELKSKVSTLENDVFTLKRKVRYITNTNE